MHPKTIGLIAHPGKPGVGDLVNSLAAEFARFSMSILLEKETAAVSGQRSEMTIAQLGGKADLLVVVGGDGTILNVTGQLGESSPPIFGINVGSLGFLTCASSPAFREAVECIAKGKMTFSNRALLEVVLRDSTEKHKPMIALNDAVFSRGELSGLIQRRRVDYRDTDRFHRLLAFRGRADLGAGIGCIRDHADLPARADESLDYCFRKVGDRSGSERAGLPDLSNRGRA